jgi:hypothetical protein
LGLPDEVFVLPGGNFVSGWGAAVWLAPWPAARSGVSGPIPIRLLWNLARTLNGTLVLGDRLGIMVTTLAAPGEAWLWSFIQIVTHFVKVLLGESIWRDYA